MKRRLLSLFLFAAVVLCTPMPAAFGQKMQEPVPSATSTPGSRRGAVGRYKPRHIVMPLKDASFKLAEITTQAAAGITIPLWSYSIVSPVDSKTYSGMMVGRSPFFHGHRTTTIQSYLVPVILTFTDTGTVFDPTAPDSCISNSTVLSVVQNSPIFQNASYTMNGASVGNTQYVDAFQRANFWTNVSVTGNRYHTTLGLTTLPAVKVTVPAANGLSFNFGGCGSIGIGNLGTMDINWWDSYVQNTLIPSLTSQGVGPETVPLFLFDSVGMYLNGDPNQCCALGYHSAYTPFSLLQTYAVNDFDTSGFFGGDISIMSHEVGEWMDDPVTNNLTPAWGNIGQVIGCQNNLEVGDPLSGIFVPPVTSNGFTYNPQELAFFSWFYRQSPSIGSGGLYSNNGTFTTSAGPVCH
jgi:hypothetical protein